MDEQAILQKIKNLERLSKRNKIILIACIACLSLALVTAAVGLAPRNTLRAKELILTDSRGNSVAHISSSGDATCLEIAGASQATSAQLCAGESYGSTLTLKNAHYMSTVFLSAGAAPEGAGSFSPGLTISEKGGQRAFVTTLGDEMKLSLGNIQDSDSLIISVRGARPEITSTGPTGEPVWTIPGNGKGPRHGARTD